MTAKRIRWIGLLLVLAMLSLPATSCRGKAPGGDPGTQAPADPTADTDAPEPQQQPEQLKILENGTTDYVIVRSWYAQDWEIELAVRFRDTIQALTGITIPIVEDYEDPDAGITRTEKEIVIGTTNREDEYSPDYESIGDGYHVFVANERLVFASKSHAGLYLAIHQFFENIYAVDIDSEDLKRLDYTDLTVTAKYNSMDSFPSGTVPYMDVNFSDYTVTYAENDYMQKRMALVISSALHSQTGLTLPCVGTDVPAAASVALCSENGNGDKIGSGKWELNVSGDTIYICASDYYGFEGAAYYLKTAYKNGHYPFSEGFTANGTYTDSLNQLTASDAYAYQHKGDVRVMFYNALWQNRTGNYDYDDVPAAERNILQAEMIAQYMPDVLGLQEMDASKRSNCQENDLGKLLSALGYVETIDPAVENRIGINCTPLFYLPETTMLIDSAYYWYQAQDANAAGNDQSSKALTWGVFENLATGERFIAISTHMCTRDAAVREKQAQEAVALISRLAEEYHCPVFIGGDYNDIAGSPAYQALIDSGCVDVQQEASVSTDIKSSKNYPKYDSQLGMMRPNGDAVPGAQNSVDHVLLYRGEDITLQVFGIVVDECTRSASDHLPLFVDFIFSADPAAGAEWSGRY